MPQLARLLTRRPILPSSSHFSCRFFFLLNSPTTKPFYTNSLSHSHPVRRVKSFSQSPASSRRVSIMSSNNAVTFAKIPKIPKPTFRSRLNFSLSPEQINELTQKVINDTKDIYDSVAKIPAHECTFDNVIKVLAAAEDNERTLSASCHFVQYVSPNKEVRDASMEAEKQLKEFGIESSMREDLFKVVSAAVKNSNLDTLSEEDRRLATKMELDFKRNGLSLPLEKREVLKKLKKELSDTCIEFSKNVNEDTTKITVTKDELQGMPEDFVNGLQKVEEDGQTRYVLTMKYPDFWPIMKLCSNAETRYKMEKAYSTRCHANIALLEKAVRLRHEEANLLGYKNHAEYQMEVKMAKHPSNVAKFLHDLQTRLTPLAQKELTILSDVKKKMGDAKDHGEDIKSWDFRYYQTKLLESEYKVDENLIKDYFSLDNVTDGMLSLYQTVLGLRFTEVEDFDRWHPDVRLFEVHDSKSSELIGAFYLDLFPREGKYSHAACFGLIPGCTLSETGARQYPVAAMVANFTKPTQDKPSLLKHDEFVTYFHELGHVMHDICSKTKWSRFHGTNTEWDFVEAPSQMLENWCWEPTVLEAMSSHYKTGAKLPSEHVNSLVKSRRVLGGLLNLRQLFFATFDMKLHAVEELPSTIDSTALYNRLRREVALIPNIEDTFGAATFGHLMGGYSAGYYGYLWSEVFSADMFLSRFKAEGITNEKVGREYRDKVLGPGGSRDGMDLLKDFLGREPTNEAFLKSLGM